jgi:hypothetical protein
VSASRLSWNQVSRSSIGVAAAIVSQVAINPDYAHWESLAGPTSYRKYLINYLQLYRYLSSALGGSGVEIEDQVRSLCHRLLSSSSDEASELQDALRHHIETLRTKNQTLVPALLT